LQLIYHESLQLVCIKLSSSSRVDASAHSTS